MKWWHQRYDLDMGYKALNNIYRGKKKSTRVRYRLLRFPHLLCSSTLSSLSPSLSIASILVAASLNAFWSKQLLVFCSTIVVSSYSNSYKLVTVVAVISL
ncbi:hypothetical protein ACTXT7_004906 [Hymenolepis weldensis]